MHLIAIAIAFFAGLVAIGLGEIARAGNGSKGGLALIAGGFTALFFGVTLIGSLISDARDRAREKS